MTLKSVLLKYAVMLLIIPLSVLAETIVIEGELLNDLRRTPVLGGGFSLTTEDYKSQCFENVETTLPSYDYDYTFYSSEKEVKHESKSSNEYGFEYGFSGYFASGEGKTAGTISQSSKFKIHRVNMFAVIRLNSYYASLNEAKSTLSTQAKDLIQSEDVIGFFDACGTYYIRTINRYSRLYAWFTLESKEEDIQADFKSHLEVAFRTSFASGAIKDKTESKSKKFFKGKRLYIKIIGVGLAKEHVVNLSPTSIEDFQKVVSNASKSMSGIHTGRISSIEIIPWMDNLSFQYELKPFVVAQAEAKPTAPKPDATDEVKKEYSKKLKEYLDEQKSASLKRKWIVAENGEFISMLKNKYRALQAYQFATMNCQTKLERIITRRENLAKQGKTPPPDFDWKTIQFKNHFGYGSINAETFYDKLLVKTGNNQTKFAKEHESQKSSGEKSGGESELTLYEQWEAISKEADSCLAALYPQFTTTIYRDIPKCKTLVAKLTALMPGVLFYYCAPVEG
ncbi:hypothetical protein [Candidatus Parabeggiatoa sp. HSG14]|uniref:hypothetical protein n=1 Tax=Candidatus Parabeggiatoa sp. HSG14 TaxID=3055593 RepID=UPI0025A8016A|nr:hypothetical protein [Thiotrichales bacterium HSG14]